MKRTSSKINKKANKGKSLNNKRQNHFIDGNFGSNRANASNFLRINNDDNSLQRNKMYNIHQFELKDNAARPVLDREKEFEDLASLKKTKKYQKELEILINLYLYEKKDFKSYIKENHNNKFYIIDKSWLYKYKSFYDYFYIRNYLSNKNINELIFEELISNISEDYEEKIIKKDELLKPSFHQYKELTKKTEKKNYKIIINYVIIDQKLFELFSNNELIEVEIQELNNDEFLISFINAKYDIQLGKFYLNEFIPAYIFDYNKNHFDTLINLIQSENFLHFKNNKMNYCALDTGYCFKVIDANTQKNKNQEIDILSFLRDLSKKDNNLNLKIISNYTCIKCDSEIEITKINICNNEKEELDTIEYNCYNCKTYNNIITLKEFLNKMIINTYLYNKCCICSSIQIDKMINNFNNIFKFCLECKKIFCNNELCLSLHQCKKKYFIDITKTKNVCLNLSHFELSERNPYFTNYCFESKKNICDNCFKISHKGHIKDKRILTYNNEKKENELLLKLIQDLQEEKSKISQEKIIKIERKKNQDIKILEKQLKDEIEKNNKNKNQELEQLEKRFNNDIKQNEQKYNQQISNYIKNFYEKMNSLLVELNNKYIEEESKSNGNDKFKIANSYISNNKHITNEYNKSITDCKNEYERTMMTIKDNYNREKSKICLDIQNKIEKAKKNYEKEVNLKNYNFEKAKIRINNETDCPLKNRIDYQIIFINVILNSYNLKEDTNYYYSKNLFILLHYFYNNENSDIYKKVFLDENIDEFKKTKNEIMKNDNNNSNNINVNDNTPKNQNHANYNINIIENEKDSNNNYNINNIITKSDNKIINEYNYKLKTTRNDLTKNVTINEKSVNFEILIINDYKYCEWPTNGRTKLISDEKSDIKITPIILENKQSEIQPINIFCDFNSDKPETKHCILNFNVDGKNYGAQIDLTIHINQDLVQQFRKEFNLLENDYPDEKLLNALNNNNNDIYKAFDSLFN